MAKLFKNRKGIYTLMSKVKDKDPLAVKFKEKEKAQSFTLTPGKIIGFRLDGKAFHTFTKGFDRPFDTKLMEAMNQATLEVINQVLPNAICAYTQSDEITIFLDERITEDSPNKEALFSGKIQKLVSVTASAAAVGFLKGLLDQGLEMPQKLPLFDSRVFLLDNLDEALENLTWRRLDARKNAITMAAESLFSSKELHGKSTRERIDMLQGTVHERLPEDFMNGRFIAPVKRKVTLDLPERGNRPAETIEVQRRVWEVLPAERDRVEGFFKDLGVEIS